MICEFLIFVIFGSTEEQDWNEMEIPETDSEMSNETAPLIH